MLTQITIEFPIIADPTREISVKYGMLDPNIKDKEGLPLTCRAVFIIGAFVNPLTASSSIVSSVKPQDQMLSGI